VRAGMLQGPVRFVVHARCPAHASCPHNKERWAADLDRRCGALHAQDLVQVWNTFAARAIAVHLCLAVQVKVFKAASYISGLKSICAVCRAVCSTRSVQEGRKVAGEEHPCNLTPMNAQRVARLQCISQRAVSLCSLVRWL